MHLRFYYADKSERKDKYRDPRLCQELGRLRGPHDPAQGKQERCVPPEGRHKSRCRDNQHVWIHRQGEAGVDRHHPETR